LVGLPVEELEKGYKVLVHCRAGKGRTGTTIAIILARIEDPSATPIKCCGPLAQHLSQMMGGDHAGNVGKVLDTKFEVI
jgi:hypothetical protein